MKTIPNDNHILKTAATFKLLSDPTRFKILYLLHTAEDGLCVHEVADAVAISHSAASHQLSKLEDRGIVTGFREGQTMCYRINDTSYTKEIISIISSSYAA